MIPTPAKRRHQQQQEYCLKGADRASMGALRDQRAADGEAAADEEGGADEDESARPPESAAHFNGFATGKFESGMADVEHDDMMAEYEDDDEDDEYDDYMRLDTIVEEDESGQVQSDREPQCDREGSVLSQANKDLVADDYGGRKQATNREGPPTENSANGVTSVCAANATRRPLDGPKQAADSTTNTSSGDDNASNKCDKPTGALQSGGDNNNTKSKQAPNGNIQNSKMARRFAQAGHNNASSNSINMNSAPPNAPPLPSTNRLISEHQARQQQRLFRALAERQKLMDELSPASGQRVDLMSAASLSESLRPVSGSAAGRSRKKRPAGPSNESGVPLSAVDLSSMSDRMLDDLLGHIASASSSSLSSNGESLDSSDLSNKEDEDEEGAEEALSDSSDARLAADEQRLRSLHRGRKSLGTDAPNVIGVHEDERTRANQGRLRQANNCRDAYRKQRRNNGDDDDHDADDDDDNHDHELLEVQLGACTSSELPDSLSPSGPAGEQLGGPRASSREQQQGSRLEDYFTRNLVNAHELSASEASLADEFPPSSGEQPAPGEHSVEEVLMRMLAALGQIGPGNQEQLNELLERGFAHLEQLLNCSLTAGRRASPVALPPAQLGAHKLGAGAPRSQQAGGGGATQKVISASQQQQTIVSQSSAMMSKDSDYGSDTQSADCFSQCAEGGAGEPAGPQQQASGAKWLAQQAPSESPSPSSLTSGSNQWPQRPAQSGAAPTGQLSPLAIELSFKLAESLHRLAQQQQQLQRAPPPPLEQEREPEPDRDDEPLERVQPETTRQAAERVPAQTSTPPAPKKSPMKSIVMINAGRPSSAASIVSSASSSALEPQPRNLTPVALSGDESAAQGRHPFKTCVSIGGAPSAVSNVIVASPARIEPKRGPEQTQDEPDLSKPVSQASEAPEEPEPELQADSPEPETSANSGEAHFISTQLRRSARRSSLRRRPSLGGSARAPREPRPSSPVPRPLAAGSVEPGEPATLQAMMGAAAERERAAAATVATSGQQALANQRQQRQLQRALILAQKYNYSPAKLAASKLSSKLQLKESTSPQTSKAGK